jgi:hypothetical protein
MVGRHGGRCIWGGGCQSSILEIWNQKKKRRRMKMASSEETVSVLGEDLFVSQGGLYCSMPPRLFSTPKSERESRLRRGKHRCRYVCCCYCRERLKTMMTMYLSLLNLNLKLVVEMEMMPESIYAN